MNLRCPLLLVLLTVSLAPAQAVPILGNDNGRIVMDEAPPPHAMTQRLFFHGHLEGTTFKPGTTLLVTVRDQAGGATDQLELPIDLTGDVTRKHGSWAIANPPTFQVDGTTDIAFDWGNKRISIIMETTTAGTLTVFRDLDIQEQFPEFDRARLTDDRRRYGKEMRDILTSYRDDLLPMVHESQFDEEVLKELLLYYSTNQERRPDLGEEQNSSAQFRGVLSDRTSDPTGLAVLSDLLTIPVHMHEAYVAELRAQLVRCGSHDALIRTWQAKEDFYLNTFADTGWMDPTGAPTRRWRARIYTNVGTPPRVLSTPATYVSVVRLHTAEKSKPVFELIVTLGGLGSDGRYAKVSFSATSSDATGKRLPPAGDPSFWNPAGVMSAPLRTLAYTGYWE